MSTNQGKVSQKASFVSEDDLLRHETLFKTYYRPLVVFAIRLIQDRYDAEDIVQEVFAQMWKKKDSMDHATEMQSYLFGAVKNGCLNKYRHLKVVHRFQIESKYLSPVNETPHHYMMLNEIAQQIDDTLNAMPAKSKNVFILSRYEQKKNKEIADMLNISIKTVEAHMSKVLLALKRNLKHYISVIIIIGVNV